MGGTVMSEILSVSNLDAGYGEVQVLHDVNMHMDDDEVVTIIGPNGAGKTTLLRTISGSLRPTSGDIQYRGESITNKKASAIARSGLIHIPQEHNIFDQMNVIDNLRVGGFTLDDHEEQLDLVFDLFPRLDERRTQTAGTLSGGERQMLAIGKGLMGEPDLLMLDEPSAGLAPNLVEQTFEQINEIRKRTDIDLLLVEQRALEALELADRAYVLENGRIAIEGPTDEVKDDKRVQETYLGI